MNNYQTVKIAGVKTIKDWQTLENKIRDDFDNKTLWEEAFLFFEHRMKARYLNPINSIKENDTYAGEGFSIVAILCSLVEGLESFYQGRFYRRAPKKNQGNPNDPEKHYFSSEELFISFLNNREPFKKEFCIRDSLAKEFYENVRCSILHEAATRNKWRIRTDTQTLITEEQDTIILNRNIFVNHVIEYMENYTKDLFRNTELKRKFIQKMNSICETS